MSKRFVNLNAPLSGVLHLVLLLLLILLLSAPAFAEMQPHGSSVPAPERVVLLYSYGDGIPAYNRLRAVYYIEVSNPTVTNVLGITRKLLRNEYGFEAFYNFAITPWLQLTPNIQVVRPAQKKFIDTQGFIPRRDECRHSDCPRPPA